MAERASGVYKIVHKQSGTTYVGSSQDVRVRWNLHRSKLGRGVHPNPHLQAAWNKYGKDAFLFEIIESCSVKRLLSREQFWLDSMCQLVRVYNVYPIVASARGYKHTTESRARMSEAHKGHVHSEEQKRKQSEANSEPYPAFVNPLLGAFILPGVNLRKLCQARRFCEVGLRNVKNGKRRSYHGWQLVGTEGIPLVRNKAYPAFRHMETGEIIDSGENLSQMCRERGLSRVCMAVVRNGKRKSHRGWMLLEGEA